MKRGIMSTPQYGEIAPPPEPVPATQIINKAATNENDLAIEREHTKRSIIRTVGVVTVFVTLLLPIIIAVSRAVPQ